MTQFSIHDFRTPSDSEKPEINSSWELRMAKLVGFEPEVTPNPIETSEEVIQIDESPQTNPDKQQSLSSNPFAKAGVVGATTLAIVLGAGTLLSQMMIGTNKKPQENVVMSPPQEKLQALKQPLPEAEIELLKTKLALADQARAVKAAQIQLKTAQSTSATPAKVNPNRQVTSIEQPIVTQKIPVATQTQTPRVIVQRLPGEVKTVYVPRIVTVERIVRVPQEKVAVTPSVKSSQRKNIPNLAVIPSSRTTALPKLASDVSIPPIPAPTPTVVSNTFQPVTPISPSQQNNSPTQTNQQPSKSVAVGSSVKAVLANGLFGETTRTSNDNDSSNDSKFVVRLKQPLKNTDNTVALPAGTELLTQIRRIGESGMMQLEVVSIVSLEDGNVKQKDIPKGALKIRAPQGRPLIANKFPNNGKAIAGMDTGLFVLGGISKAAELANRPESSLNINGNNVITQTNPKPNILTGVLEGGLTTVVPQITIRNQQAISEMSTRGNIWVLPAGKEVEVYVNQIMQF
jgi:Bacterial conjugation TrbI-like protein